MKKKIVVPHHTAWEDEQTVMLKSCGDFQFSPNNALIITADEEEIAKCPNCKRILKLHWDVWIEDIPEEEYEKRMSES